MKKILLTLLFPLTILLILSCNKDESNSSNNNNNTSCSGGSITIKIDGVSKTVTSFTASLIKTTNSLIIEHNKGIGLSINAYLSDGGVVVFQSEDYRDGHADCIKTNQIYTIDMFACAQTTYIPDESIYTEVCASAIIQYYPNGLTGGTLFSAADVDSDNINFPTDYGITYTKCSNNKVSGTFKSVLNNRSSGNQVDISGNFTDVCYTIQ